MTVTDTEVSAAAALAPGDLRDAVMKEPKISFGVSSGRPTFPSVSRDYLTGRSVLLLNASLAPAQSRQRAPKERKYVEDVVLANGCDRIIDNCPFLLYSRFSCFI